MFDNRIKASDVRARIEELKATEPTSYTTMHISWFNTETGEGNTVKEDAFYKDHPYYEHMPPVTQSPGTEAEHAAWWAWYRQRGSDAH